MNNDDNKSDNNDVKKFNLTITNTSQVSDSSKIE